MKWYSKYLLYAGLMGQVIISSCSALSKSQKSAVEEFASSAKEYSEAPKQLLKSYSECILKYDQLEAASLDDQNQMVQKLQLAGNAYFKRDKFINDLTTSFQLIEKYSKALQEFVNVDVSKDFKESITTLGNNIDTLINKSENAKIKTIPVGFGSIAAKLIQNIGQRRISHKQLKEARQFTAQGDMLVEKVSTVLNELVLDALMKGRLEGVRDGLKAQFLKFLGGIESANKGADQRYSTLNPIYVEIRGCTEASLLLLVKVAEATSKFRAAHQEMMKKLDKNEADLIIKNIGSFTQEVSEMHDLIKQYKDKL